MSLNLDLVRKLDELMAIAMTHIHNHLGTMRAVDEFKTEVHDRFDVLDEEKDAEDEAGRS